MIKVVYNTQKIEISGHANFNSNGNDIVCASVSSIIYTTVNGIMNINCNAIKYEDNDKFIIYVLSNDEITVKLIENMIDLLTDLAKQYPKNIKISKGE